MKPKSAILSGLCAAALIGAAIGLAVEHHNRVRLAEENKALRQQLSRLESLTGENERLSNFVARVSRGRSLPDEQLRELLRLRGEVGVLRQQSSALDKLREENRQVRSALENNLKPQSVTAAGAAATADYWPRDSWAYAGYESPDAALQSCFWAANQGDMKTFLGGFTGEALKDVEKHYEGVAENEASAKVRDEVAEMKSVRVLSREAQADDAVMLTVEIENGDHTHTEKLLMKKIGSEWKLSGPP